MKWISLDWITLIIQKKQNEQCEISEGGFLLGNPFIFKLGQQLEPLELNKWNAKIYQSPSTNVKETQFTYILNITGKFFLKENYKEKVNALIKFFKENGYHYHFTRVDVAITSDSSFESIYRKIKKLKIKKMKKVEYSQHGKVGYCAIYNSRFSLVLYDKILQLSTVRDEEYKKDFSRKFNGAIQLSRLEVRLKGSDVCMAISLANEPLAVAVAEAVKNVTKRLEGTAQILKMINEK